MLFVQSLRGLSHTKLEDTKEEHLELAVQALDRLATKTIERAVAMPELPSGTVTFLFSDIEGSTSLLQELGDAYAGALAEHRGVFRAAFAEHGGVEVDTQGDAFFAAFARASDAVAAAAEIQRRLGPGPIRVRIGRAHRRAADHGRGLRRPGCAPRRSCLRSRARRAGTALADHARARRRGGLRSR